MVNDLISKFFRILKVLLKELNSPQDMQAFLDRISKPIKGLNDDYINYQIYKNKCDYLIENLPVFNKKNRTGIVIQGPICYENDFTINTIRLYRKLFSSLLIVLSTWEDQNTDDIQRLNYDNLIIITNEYPKQKGYFNVNKMIVSTLKGLQTLKDYGIEYIIRTRTDQRIQFENVEAFFYELLNKFKLSVDNNNQKSRIITIGKFTLQYIPFLISDMFQFGHTEDLLDYWSIELSKKNVDLEEWIKIHREVKIIDEQRLDHSEIYLGIHFAKLKLRDEYKYDYYTYYKFLSERFIILDTDMIGFLWHKSTNNGRNIFVDEPELKLSQCFTFKEWFLLQQGCVDIALFNQQNLHKLQLCRFKSGILPDF